MIGACSNRLSQWELIRYDSPSYVSEEGYPVVSNNNKHFKVLRLNDVVMKPCLDPLSSHKHSPFNLQEMEKLEKLGFLISKRTAKKAEGWVDNADYQLVNNQTELERVRHLGDIQDEIPIYKTRVYPTRTWKQVFLVVMYYFCIPLILGTIAWRLNPSWDLKYVLLISSFSSLGITIAYNVIRIPLLFIYLIGLGFKRWREGTGFRTILCQHSVAWIKSIGISIVNIVKAVFFDIALNLPCSIPL